MALNGITLKFLSSTYLAIGGRPRVLSFGYPDNLGEWERGCELVSVDLFPHRGPEVCANLNRSWRDNGLEEFVGAFDLVLDCGTTEHCVNPCQALVNAAAACRPGGRVFHHLPVTMVNHGYWNVCPSYLRDFYQTANGFTIEHCELTGGGDSFSTHEQLRWSGDPYGPTQVPPDSLILFIARRPEPEAAIRLPYCETKWGAANPTITEL